MMNNVLEAQYLANILILKIKVSEITLSNMGEVRKEYQKIEVRAQESAIIDLLDVSLLDSSAIGWVISIHQEYKKKQGKLCIACKNQDIRKVFSLTFIDKFIEIYDNLSDAVKAQQTDHSNRMEASL